MIEALHDPEEESRKNRDELIADMTAYEQVREMAQHPSWPIFILALQKEAKKWRGICEDYLEAIVLKRSAADESAFADARVQLLAHEMAIQIYLALRDKHAIARQLLDQMQAKELDSPQNGEVPR